MKKHLIYALCFCIIISCLFSGCTTAEAPSTQENITTPESKPQATDEKKSTEVVRRIDVMASLVEMYVDYPSLVANAEMIVKGVVSEANSFSNDYGGVDTNLVITVNETLKGQELESVPVIISGGRVASTDFYLANEEMLRDKFSDENVDTAMSSFEPTDIIESIYMGIENLEVGEAVVLFLKYHPESDIYACIGSTYCGLFRYDAVENSICKVINNEILLSSNYDTFKELVPITPDNSENLKIQARNVVPVFKDPTIIPRDPYYDQFKD